MDEDISLFSEFPPVSAEDWEAQIHTDLKGKDYEKTLTWHTREGFKVLPYYREENIRDLDFINDLPGQFPYVRGKKAKGNNWLVRQEIQVSGISQANAVALDILTKGVDSLGFAFKVNKPVSIDDLKALMQGIDLEKVEVNFSMPGRKRDLINNIAAYLKGERINPEKLKVSVNYDPIGAFTLRGKFCTTEGEAFIRLKEIVELTAEFPGFQVINVNGLHFTNAGSSIVQELGYSLAIGADYLTRLTELGMDAGVVAPKIRFNFGISGNYFMEIAKIRAARLLWSKVVEAYNPKCINCDEVKDGICLCAGKMNIHSETSLWNKTIYDPYVNMLRTQTEAMSAVLGGTDSLTVLPFDVVYEQPGEFAERIARNQQSLLKYEANFDKIADPAAGSYYIESLTASIAEQAWKIFLEIQDKGGFVTAFREGSIQSQLKEMAEKRMKAIGSRRDNILGVNQFANVAEQISAEINPAVFDFQDLKEDGAEVETIKMFRAAREFEALRYSTDQFGNLNPRPKVFLLTIGDLIMRKARAQFSGNFFAVAGYDIIDNNGFTSVEEGVKAAIEADSDIIVLCSSDDEYAVFAPEAFRMVNNQAIFVVAGAPACTDELKAIGIENFISIKTNLLESLTDFNDKLGIKKAI